MVQGEIIAGAIASSATADSFGTYIDRDRLLELQPGENYGDEGVTGLEFSINPERVAPVLRRLISPTKTRARIYDTHGYLILDSRNLYIPGEVVRLDLPPPNEKKPNIFKRGWNAFRLWLGYGDLPLYHELGADAGKDYSEVAQAPLRAKSAYMVRVTDRGQVIVSVAVPVQRFRAVRGRAAALDPRRRHQPGGRGPSGSRSSSCSASCWLSWVCCRRCSPAPSPARSSGSPTAPSGCATASVRVSKFPTSTARRDEIGDLSGRFAT